MLEEQLGQVQVPPLDRQAQSRIHLGLATASMAQQEVQDPRVALRDGHRDGVVYVLPAEWL